MKLRAEAYNPEIAHCAGGRRAVCKRCLRYALYKTWQTMDPLGTESIILLPPKATPGGCRCVVKMAKGYERRKNAPADMLIDERGHRFAV